MTKHSQKLALEIISELDWRVFLANPRNKQPYNSLISADLNAKIFCGVKKLQKNQLRRKVFYEFSKSN